MFKKILLSSLIFFSFFVIVFVLIFFNINLILNHNQVKARISKFVQENYKIELRYEKIKINLLQNKIFIKKLFFKSPQYELFLPQGKFVFSFSKIFKLNFTPKGIFSENGYLKIYKTKKPFRLENLIKNLAELSPIYIVLKNMLIDYESPQGWISLKNFNLKLRVDKGQALYEVESSSEIFKKANFKGRFNYKNLFSENTLEAKKINLSNLQGLSKYGILKTDFDLKSEIVVEKETFNIAFVVSNPYLFLKKIPSEKLLGGHLNGIIIGNKEQIKFTVSPLVINYPKIKGSIELIKNKEGYKLLADAEEFNFSDTRYLLSKLFSENKNIEKFLAIVKGGIFSKAKIESSGREIKELFKLENLVFKSRVNLGQIELSELSFDFKNIEGKVAFEKGVLQFNGSAILNEKTPLKVDELRLEFRKKDLNLFVHGGFYSVPEEIIKISSHFMKNSDFLKNYQFEGDIKGIVELKGSIHDLKGNITLFLENFLLKTPYLSHLINIKKGTLVYDLEKKIFVENLTLFSDNSYIEELTAKFDLKTQDIDFLAKGILLSPKIIKELNKNEEINNLFYRYDISFENLYLDYLEYKGNLEYFKSNSTAEELKRHITAKGNLRKLDFKVPYREEMFNIKIEKLPFKYEKNRIYLDNTLVYMEDSIFRIGGEIFGKNFIINGEGGINKGLENKIKTLSQSFPKVSIHTPIKIKDFSFVYENGEIFYSGLHTINDIGVSVDLRKKEKKWDVNLKFLSEGSDLKVYLNKKDSQVELITEGIMNLKDLSELIEEEKYNISGKINLSLNLNIPDISKIKDFKSFLIFYLNSDLIGKNSCLKVENFQYFYNKELLFSTSFLGNFTEKKIEISDFYLKWNGHKINGNFSLTKKKDYLYLSGDLFGKEVNFKKLIKEKKSAEKSKDIFQVLDDIPFVADISFNVDSLTLPTSHHFDHIKGEISLDNKNKLLMVSIPELRFCNLSLEAIYEKDPTNQCIYIEVLPSKGDFLDLFSCLYPEEMPKVILEGSYNLKGYFYGEGETNTLIKKGEGKFEITSNKGYIYRAPLLAKILSYLSPIDLFKGKVTNLESNLLEYEELDIKGFFENSTLHIDNGFLSAVGFRLFGEGDVNFYTKKLNLTFYISPFKTLDVIIEKIPYLGELILGKPRMLVYLPLQVTGTYENYQIIPLHPSSVGKGILNFIFRIFDVSEQYYKEGKENKENEKRESIKQKFLERKEIYENKSP